MKIVLNELKAQNGQNFYFYCDDKILDLLAQLKKVYSAMPEYNNKKLYRHNMIKTTISDIDIESANETSFIESLAAIICGRIKNKNQKTALNLLKMLESGLLEQETKLSHKYVIEIWSALTKSNRNIESFYKGYRKVGVTVGSGFHIGRSVVYKAPNASEVPKMMEGLINFTNDGKIADDPFNNVLLKVIIFSAYFVYIHPFSDGNGRVSRLLMNKILVDNKLNKFRYVSINSEIIKRKKEYFEELKNLENLTNPDMTQYIEFMLALLLRLFLKISRPNRRELDFGTLNNRERIMLNVIRGQNLGMSVKNYKSIWNDIAIEQGYLKINIKQAEQDLTHLFQLDFIVVDERYVLYPGFKFYNK